MFLTYFASLHFAIVVSGLEAGLRGRQGTSADSDWDGPPTAAVYSERKELMPAHSTQAVELLRFVTAYKQGVSAFVDATPYSALIKASADTDGELTFFAFIDTWVGNNSMQKRDVMAMSADSSKCTPTQKEEEAWGGGGQYGNGWQLDANLVFFPKGEGAAMVDTRPRESVTLSSGYYGQYSFGAITVHEGQIAGGGKQIQLKEATDLTGTLDAEVYPCRGGASDVQRGLKMGQRAKRLSAMGVVNSSAMQSDIEEVFNDIKNDAIKDVTVTYTNPEKRQVEVTFDKNLIDAKVGTPVFYHPDDIIMERGANESFDKDAEVGKVISVDGNKATIQMSGACLPSTLHLNVPRLKLAKTPDALVVARTLADSLKTVKNRMPEQIDADEDVQPQDDAIALLARRKRKQAEARNAAKDHTNIELNFEAPTFKPFLVGQDENTALSPLNIIGRVDLGELQKKGITCAPNVLSFLQEEEHVESLMQQDARVEQRSSGKQEIVPVIAQTLGRMALGKSGMPGMAVAGSPLSTAERLLDEAGATGIPGDLVPKAPGLEDGDKVCILARHAQGRVFERKFFLPTFSPAAQDTEGARGASIATKNNDHVLLQFAVTGHGWSGSTEQCSEFCHAIYHIMINGKYAFNVTEWRDDCQRNPIDGQYGTWTISRNGWCPGSVEPGLHLDMTKFAKNGENHIAVDVSVYSSKNGKYQPYINYGGFQGGDNAVLDIGATAFIYDGAAVDAIKKQSKPFSAAEKALREGCSVPAALHKPEESNAEFASALLALGEISDVKSQPAKVARESRVKPHASLRAHGSDVEATGNRFDFESQAPWYLYDQNKNGPPGEKLGATIVPAFVDGLIQINSREIRVKVNKKLLPTEWSQLGIQLVLQRPGDDESSLTGLEMDHWDRVGSFGLLYEETALSTTDAAHSMVKLHPSAGRKLQKTFSLL